MMMQMTAPRTYTAAGVRNAVAGGVDSLATRSFSAFFPTTA